MKPSNLAIAYAAVVVACFAASGLAPVLAQAEPIQLNAGQFDEVGHFFQQEATKLPEVLKPFALRLFGLLAVISFALFFIRWMKGERDLGVFIMALTIEILKVGFFYWLVIDGPNIVMQFMGYFTEAGSRAAGVGALSPSGVVAVGYDAFFRIGEAVSQLGLLESFTVGLIVSLASLGIVLSFVGIAILMLMRIIELYMVVHAGTLLLGFGGLSFTKDIPKNYLSYAISAGTQLFMLYVIVGVGMALAESWVQALGSLDSSSLVERSINVLSLSLVFFALAWQIPKQAASLVNGSVSLGAGDVVAPAAAAAGAAGAVAGVATGGAAAALGGLAKATQGAVQATSAGMSLAAEQGASGLQAAVKGLGHAAKATASEVGSAAKSRVGLSPPSPHSVDHRGREVGNVGTRAANALSEQTQAFREEKASRPAPAAGDQGGKPEPNSNGERPPPGSGESSRAPAVPGTEARGGGESTSQMADAPASASSPVSAASGDSAGDGQELSITKPSNAAGASAPPSEPFNDASSGGPRRSGGPRYSPPALPSDEAPSSAISITFDPD